MSVITKRVFALMIIALLIVWPIGCDLSEADRDGTKSPPPRPQVMQQDIDDEDFDSDNNLLDEWSDDSTDESVEDEDTDEEVEE